MSKSFELIERVGISTIGVTEAIKSALLEVKSESKVAWFEVIEQRGRVTQDDQIEFQVTVRIGRKLAD